MMLDTFLSDLRVGARVLFKEKGFCALAVLVLAIGIAAVATQFAVVNGLLLRPFPFPDGDRLVDVRFVDPTNFRPDNFNSRMTTADFVEIRDAQTSFSAFFGHIGGSTVNLTHRGQPKRLTGGYVTWDYFRSLGVSPVLGRDFLPEEDRPGVDKAVLLADRLWRDEFGADPGVIGRAVRINGHSGTVVGVMPPGFAFPTNEQLWIPITAEFPVRARSDRGINFILAVGRLKPGVTLAQAEAEMTSFAQRFAAEHPVTNGPFTRAYLRPLIAEFTGPQLKTMLYTMLTFCVGVLLIACVNVMNMQFARATLRSKELAIRSSLGATRWRLVRQMLTESLLLAAIGAVFGTGLAFWTTGLLDDIVRNIQNPLPAWMVFAIDLRVLAFVVAATVLAAIVSGFVPAWLASRANATEVLKEGGRGNTAAGVGLITRGLVVLQILVTCVLLIGALLQVQSIIKQQSVDYGYDTGAVLAGRMGLMEAQYPTPADRALAYERMLRELRANPQFAGAALTNRLRMIFSGAGPVEIEGRTYATDSDRTIARFENISPGYFETIGVALREGRDFTDQDDDQRQPVAIVNARFAAKHFPGESALGRRFRTTQQNGSNPGPWRTIVGVVADVRMQGPFDTQSDGAGFYLPFFVPPFGPSEAMRTAPQFATVVVRPVGNQRPEALASALQATINRVDPDLPLYFVATPQASIHGQLAENRIGAAMFAIFGAIAVLLAAVGLYGVMSFSVNQRTQEFGIRMALGADSAAILRMVLRQGTGQVVLGLALGLGLTLALAIVGRDAIANFLFQTSPTHLPTYLGVGLLVVAVALLAVLVPALRATRVDPLEALRTE
jgi:putative ABC transport system permease protein